MDPSGHEGFPCCSVRIGIQARGSILEHAICRTQPDFKGKSETLFRAEDHFRRKQIIEWLCEKRLWPVPVEHTGSRGLEHTLYQDMIQKREPAPPRSGPCRKRQRLLEAGPPGNDVLPEIAGVGQAPEGPPVTPATR